MQKRKREQEPSHALTLAWQQGLDDLERGNWNASRHQLICVSQGLCVCKPVNAGNALSPPKDLIDFVQQKIASLERLTTGLDLRCLPDRGKRIQHQVTNLKLVLVAMLVKPFVF